MADKKKQGGKGGGARKHGNQSNACKAWRSEHDPRSGTAHKVNGSREHRGRGALTLYIQFQKALAAAYASTHSGRDGVVLVLDGKITIAH